MAEYYEVNFLGIPELTPTVTSYKKLSDDTDVTPVPVITAINQTLGFFKMLKPDAMSEPMSIIIDGGSSITSASNRYKAGFITPNDFVNGVNTIQVAGTNQTAGDIPAKIGTPVALDGGAATLGAMLTKMADNNGGADFRAVADSLHALTGAVGVIVPSSVTASSDTLLIGTQISGSYLDTFLNNSAYMITAPVAVNGLSRFIEFELGTGKGNSVSINGRFQAGTSRLATVSAYNWSTLTYENISDGSTGLSSNMVNSSVDIDYKYTLLPQHTSSSGTVRIRFLSTSTTTGDRLNIDQALVESITSGATTAEIADAVYAKMKYTVYAGQICIDTINGTAGAVVGVNGLVSNPVNNLADAITLAGLVGVRRFHLMPDSPITLTQGFPNWEFVGKGIINLNGQVTDDAIFDNSELIEGICVGDDQDFDNCNFGIATLNSCHMHNCTFKDDGVTLTSNSMVIITNGIDASAAGTSAPSFILQENVSIGFRGFDGGVRLRGMTTGCQAIVSGYFRLIIGSDCLGGNIICRGFGKDYTDEVVGGFQGIIDGSSRFDTDQSLASITDKTGFSLTDVYDPAKTAAQDATVLKSVDYVEPDNITIAGIAVAIGTPNDLGTGASISSNTADIFNAPAADVNVTSIDGSAEAATSLKRSAETMFVGTVDISNFTPTTTEFECAGITDAAAAHYRDRWVIFGEGTLKRQARLIKNYALVSGRGHFVVDALTSIPANAERFVIV